MLDTSQIVTPFNALWSHNVAHSCDHATFSVDCCYDILQHLLRICMFTKTFVNFRPYITPDIQSSKYFTTANIKTNHALSVGLIMMLCCGLRYKINPPIRRMLSLS